LRDEGGELIGRVEGLGIFSRHGRSAHGGAQRAGLTSITLTGVDAVSAA
jgi:hypothetical protein